MHRSPSLFLCRCRHSDRFGPEMEALARWLEAQGLACACDPQGDSMDPDKRARLLESDCNLLVCSDCPAPDHEQVVHATGEVRPVRFRCLDILERRGIPREKCRTINFAQRPQHGQNPCRPLSLACEADRMALLTGIRELLSALDGLRQELAPPARILDHQLEAVQAALAVGTGLAAAQAQLQRILPGYARAARYCPAGQDAALGLRPAVAVARLADVARELDAARRPELARGVWRSALELAELSLPAQDPAIAEALLGLAASLWGLGQAADAEQRVRLALDMLVERHGLEHAETARGLNMLAGLVWSRGDLLEAEKLLGRCLAIHQSHAQDVRTAEALNNLGELLRVQERFAEAEPRLLAALELRQGLLGPEHPLTVQSLANLAKLRYAQGRFSEAEVLLRHSLRVRRAHLAADHPDVAATLNDLAMLLEALGDFPQAEELLAQAVAGYAGHAHQSVALENHARVLERLGREAEASAARAQASAARSAWAARRDA